MLTRQCEVVAGVVLLLGRFADDADDEGRDGNVDALDVGRAQAVLASQAQHGVDVRMDDVRGRERLERRVAAVPAIAEAVGDALEARRRLDVLQVRGEEAEAPLEDFDGTSRAGLGQMGRGDAALRRPAGVQELRVGPVDPALEDAAGEAAADTERPRATVGIEPEQPARERGGTKGAEQPGRVEAALVELPGGDAADAAGHFVADGHGRDQVAAGDGRRLGNGHRRGDGRAAHVHDRLVVRVVVFERLRKGAVCEGRRGHADLVAAAEDGARAIRRHRGHRRTRVERPSGESAPASERPMMSRTRSFVVSTTSRGSTSFGVVTAQRAISVERAYIRYVSGAKVRT